MTKKVTLFDIPTRAPAKTWSLNPWKTRLVLNFKGIDYETKWLEYPDIKKRLQEHVGPVPGSEHTHGQPTWTIPTVILPSGTYLSDSRAIATAVDAEFPSPPLHLTHPSLARLEALNQDIVNGLVGVFVPRVGVDYLGEASAGYFVETRTRFFGKSLEEVEREDGGPGAWEGVAGKIREVEGLFGEVEGRYFLGEKVSYLDFVWVGTLLFLKGLEGSWEEFKRVAGDIGVHEGLLEACKEWTVRDSY